MEKYTVDYYYMISPEVDVVGSNKKEYFDVIRNKNETVTVNVYNVKNKT